MEDFENKALEIKQRYQGLGYLVISEMVSELNVCYNKSRISDHRDKEEFFIERLSFWNKVAMHYAGIMPGGPILVVEDKSTIDYSLMATMHRIHGNLIVVDKKDVGTLIQDKHSFDEFLKNNPLPEIVPIPYIRHIEPDEIKSGKESRRERREIDRKTNKFLKK